MIDPDKLEQGLNLLVVDDHPVVRQGIRVMLALEDRFRIMAEAASAREALAAIQKETPDLTIIDISLKDSDGLELIKDTRAFDHDFPILVMSMHEEKLYANACSKPVPTATLLRDRLWSRRIPDPIRSRAT